MLKAKKFSQAHYLPSIIFFFSIIVLCVWSIGNAINQALTNVGVPVEVCNNCGIELKGE